jgi:hypothetical protein
MTIVSSFRSADSQYLKIHLWRKRRRKRSKNKDRFLCVDETIVIEWFFARFCNLKKFLTADYFFIADFFIADSFLIADFFLNANSFLTANYLAYNDFYQSFFVFNASVIIIIENEDIWLFQITLLNNEFEELFVVRKDFVCVKKTRDKYWVLNSTYNCLY